MTQIICITLYSHVINHHVSNDQHDCSIHGTGLVEGRHQVGDIQLSAVQAPWLPTDVNLSCGFAVGSPE